jgi:hypothetical protein
MCSLAPPAAFIAFITMGFITAAAGFLSKLVFFTAAAGFLSKLAA